MSNIFPQGLTAQDSGFPFQESLYDDLVLREQDEKRAKACFFTGHRKIPVKHKPLILRHLNARLSQLYASGIKEFHAGGALGFDTLAAMQVIDMKRDHPDMRLVLELPYPSQSDRWSQDQRRIYDFILEMADACHYISEAPPKNIYEARKFLLARNDRMVNAAHYCITYFSGGKGGTRYTLANAEKHGCEIYNIFEDIENF